RLSVASSCNSRPRISRPSSAKANANAARKAFVRSTKRLLAEITEGLTRHIDVRPVISKLTGYNRPPNNASLKRVIHANPMWNEDGKLLPEVNLSDHGDGMAERVGFEPTVEFPLHTLSKRARSTTPTSLRLDSTTCERSGSG